jgi:uncharacterized protein DUF2783
MGMLRVELGLERPDDMYDALMRTFDGLTEEQSQLVMAKLILLLANHIGDAQVLSEALAIAKDDMIQGGSAQRDLKAPPRQENAS